MDCINSKGSDAEFFAKTVGGIADNVLGKINVSLFDLAKQNSTLRSNPTKIANLIALCQNVAATSIKPAIECKNLLASNSLGPIVFCSPELGRWSTVGGLGVMVDELSVGLANLG